MNVFVIALKFCRLGDSGQNRCEIECSSYSCTPKIFQKSNSNFL